MSKTYLRITDDGFGFVVEDFHTILPTDITIEQKDYERFFELQSEGKEFRLKTSKTGTKLFDCIEEYTSEQPIIAETIGSDEHLLDLDYKISLLELGGNA